MLTAVTRYPYRINEFTVVPAWAFLDVVTSDSFSPALAMQFVNMPDSTVGTLVPTSSSSVSLNTSLTTPSETSTLAPVKPNNEVNNTPAIIGGSVGGVLGLGLIVLLALYLFKRSSDKRNRGRLTPDVLSTPTALEFTRPSTSMYGSPTKSFYSPPNNPETSGPV
jgi:hypothetical protein